LIAINLSSPAWSNIRDGSFQLRHEEGLASTNQDWTLALRRQWAGVNILKSINYKLTRSKSIFEGSCDFQSQFMNLYSVSKEWNNEFF
jgi:hypothetical protein